MRSLEPKRNTQDTSLLLGIDDDETHLDKSQQTMVKMIGKMMDDKLDDKLERFETRIQTEFDNMQSHVTDRCRGKCN